MIVEMKDVFEVQDDIARSITQALRISLSPQKEKTIARKLTEMSQAYDYLLRGRRYTRRENLEFALQMFEHAIKLDPGFALAHAGIANVCGMLFELHGRDPRSIENGLAAANRASSWNRSCRKPCRRAPAFSWHKSNTASIDYARRRSTARWIARPPGDVLGRALFIARSVEEAVELANRSIEVCDDDYNVYIPYLNALSASRRNRGVSTLCAKNSSIRSTSDRCCSRGRPCTHAARQQLCFLGNKNDAAQQLEKLLPYVPMMPVPLITSLHLRPSRATRRSTGHGQAAHRLRFSDIEWISRDTDLACLHGDPDFERLVGKNSSGT